VLAVGVGARGAEACAAQWRSTTSQRLIGDTQGFEAVTVVDRSHAWAVGSKVVSGTWLRPLVLRWKGKRWTELGNPFRSGDFRDVVAVGPNDLWAVGEQHDTALVAHWDGRRWHRERAPGTSGGFWGIEVGDSGRLWMVHQRGVYDWTARRWRLRVPQAQELEGVVFRTPTDAWAWAVVDRKPDRFQQRGGAIYRTRNGGWVKTLFPARSIGEVVIDGRGVWARGRTEHQNRLLRWAGRWRRVSGLRDPVSVVAAPGGAPYLLSRGDPWRLGRLGGPAAAVPLGEQDAVSSFDVRDGVAAIVTPSQLLIGPITC
jgi:hypothetical protein